MQQIGSFEIFRLPASRFQRLETDRFHLRQRLGDGEGGMSLFGKSSDKKKKKKIAVRRKRCTVSRYLQLVLTVSEEAGGSSKKLDDFDPIV